MKTVVITGSARGFGFALAKEFRKNNFNVVLSDLLEDKLLEAKKNLEESIKSEATILSVKCDVTKEKDLNNLMAKTLEAYNCVDIWINNAGVNQPMVPIWEVDSSVVDKLIDIDLKSAMMASIIATRQMIKQGFGQIYGVEGMGSNGSKQFGLSIYGTGKKGMTHFLECLSYEVAEKNLPIQIGFITPGIMITNFVSHSLGTNEFELSEKTKKVYNILGDYPETIAEFMVPKIIYNTKNGARFTWLTNFRAAKRFMMAPFNKRNFFKK